MHPDIQKVIDDLDHGAANAAEDVVAAQRRHEKATARHRAGLSVAEAAHSVIQAAESVIEGLRAKLDKAREEAAAMRGERDAALARVDSFREGFSRIAALLGLHSGRPPLTWGDVEAAVQRVLAERDAAQKDRATHVSHLGKLLAHVDELEAAGTPAPLEWLPNTGKDPGGLYVVVRFRYGGIETVPAPGEWSWAISDKPDAITHYLPIPAPPRLLVAPDEN